MPPVKTAASSTDVDNEATAELPVLDVAAYEAALGDTVASTDTWNVPPGAIAAVVAQVEAVPLPVTVEVIPTLRAAESEDLLDLSGTHEMPAMPMVNPAANKVIKATPVSVPAAAAPVARVAATPAPIALPPSPPLIEELRNALAMAERRVEELNERARIADADRAVASARAAAENAQLREQLGLRQETLHSSAARLGVQRADQAELEDELFARADRIEALQREMAAQGEVLARIRAAPDESEHRGRRLDADVANLGTALERRDGQIGVLEADLAARQARERDIQSRLTEALASADPHMPELRTRLAAQDEEIRALREQLAAAQALCAEKNADLEVAEESIHNLELDVRDKTGKLEEANVTVEEWRAVIAESQRSKIG